MRKDPLLILEAAYRFDIDDGSWLRGIVDAARPYDLGGGIMSYVTELAPHPRIRSFVGDGTGFDVEAVERSLRTQSPSLLARVHTPRPLAYSRDILDRMFAAAGVTHEAMLQAVGFDVPSMWWAVGGDPAGPRVAAAFFTEDRDRLAPKDRGIIDAVTAHLGAALRLRAVLRREPSGDDAPVEAVLSPDGRVLDAHPGAARRARPLLADAVRRLDRARTRKATPDERLAIWTALVDGRWSILESAERDGKHMLLACRNEPLTLPMRRLTERERAVAQYCALGHSQKYIAYELGLSMPAVSATLRSALRKLGLKSRADLIVTFGAKPRSRA